MRTQHMPLHFGNRRDGHWIVFLQRAGAAVFLRCAAAVGLLLWTSGCLVKNEPAGSGSSPQGEAAAVSADKSTDATVDSPANTQSANTPSEVTTPLGSTLVTIPAGRFSMGSARGAADEQPVHEVELSSFLMDKYEVTQDLLAKLEFPNPSHFKGERRPAEQIRWTDAALICNARSRAEGLEPCYDEATFACNFDASGYRLPTEAEWEYAARAESTEDEPLDVALPRLDQQACYVGNSGQQTDVVGKRRPNAWGLHDLRGNVAEWCHDAYQADYYGASPARDPRGPESGDQRVMRGGAWNAEPAACRLTARQADDSGISDACFARDTHGFRCVRRVDVQK